MNLWHIAGRLGRNAELRRTQAGDPVCNFSVAVDQRRGEDRTTLWVDCSLWGKRGEALSDHLTRGSAVAISGAASVRIHDGKAYMQCRVSEITLLGGSRSDGGGRDSGAGAGRPDDRRPQGDDLDDEVPFD